MEEAERHAKGRAQQWLAERLTDVGEKEYTIQRVQNWKTRGIPKGEYETLATALGKTLDWVAGVERVERGALELTPLEVRLVKAFRALEIEDAEALGRRRKGPALVHTAQAPSPGSFVGDPESTVAAARRKAKGARHKNN